ncbi:ER-golgi trafficking TRAPP I complex 85 kDa subunit-domain-containing protein [Phialemonium atrogriseum]|uniref:ER-golgi trafficking TRAPP I complex 85 kDa subunit-domain-containing protein n=1 Tax=Phialemonium atrogriseum TaxID=1093897 RepID=A0AAJ0C103_9PEZI|nr:ER-golgi trafficking TRAPP I complex 85 kDa subunit-domain-containing protein [Phialemonium atrogriseum]KAK1766702.1 ER-golgi trafficking TRAPP I complex 85 kDa subunit-domain-containing protein [Phialemonium atrogriseum]
MQPLDDASQEESIQSLPMAASALRPPKQRHSLATDGHPLSRSEASLPYRDRRSSPSAASLFASTLTPPGSRSASPAGRFSPPGPTSGSVFGGGFKQSLLDTGAADNPGDPLNLILRSFVPHIAIYGSQDVEELVREKGFDGGLWQLLRPFGERIQGKVNVRDSNGGARAWEDFSVRFVRFGDGVEEPEEPELAAAAAAAARKNPLSSPPNGRPASPKRRISGIATVEAVVNRHLHYAEDAYVDFMSLNTPTRQGLDVDATSPYYALYLRRILSGIPVACHETFGHPVACIMAISSRNPTPIDALRELYAETSEGAKRLPAWVDGTYLRYYVLVHDEEKSDIAKSLALFEQMKRHLGLHCHLLRIRSSQGAETDDDSIPLPRSDWMTADEELRDIERSDDKEDFEDPTRYIFESDATAIRTFVREMVTQSVVPTMERNVLKWNDQVASRRRGISGRFMSLSKRWAFGSGNRNSTGSSGSGSSNNYDASGFYRADSPEAIMRKLADYAFMLRDWKLAMSTYELLRGDFQNDKAWKYHAAANEMAALSLLIMPQNMSSKNRIETINQMLEQALYSYLTRCGAQFGALRCLVLALELLRLRGGSGIDEAVKWGTRLLESRLVGAVGDALLKERMAVCYATKSGGGSQAWGARRRKSALWSVLSAETWLAQSKFVQAQRCLNEARKMYSLLPSEYGVQKFAFASDFMAQLQAELKEALAGKDGAAYEDGSLDGQEEVELLVDEESETLDRRRSRRTSLIVAPGAAGPILETEPLTPLVPAARTLASIEDEDGGTSAKDGFG